MDKELIKKIKSENNYVFVVISYRQCKDEYIIKNNGYFQYVFEKRKIAVEYLKYKIQGNFKYCKKRKAFISEFQNDFNLISVFKILEVKIGKG